jgi:hypothetical protein
MCLVDLNGQGKLTELEQCVGNRSNFVTHYLMEWPWRAIRRAIRRPSQDLTC